MAWECPVCDNGNEPAHDHRHCIITLDDALGTARAAMGDDDLPFLDDGITRLRTRLREAEARVAQAMADMQHIRDALDPLCPPDGAARHFAAVIRAKLDAALETPKEGT